MRNRRSALAALAAACGYAALGTAGVFSQPAAAERDIVSQAANALGGSDLILSLKTLRIDGYGQLAYQNGGGNITASIDAPQKWVNINGFQRTIDLEHGRMRVQQRLVQDFVLAYARNMTGAIRNHQVLDGDVAFNIGADGTATRAAEAAVRARRLEMLAHPIAIVRAALEPATKVSNLRRMGALQLVDLTTARRDALTLAVDAGTHLPAWVSMDTKDRKDPT
jgi:hypothetical protein